MYRKIICKVLKFLRSTYYTALIGNPSKRLIEADKLKAEIGEICTNTKCCYGAPKIHKIIESRGKVSPLKENYANVGYGPSLYYSKKVLSTLT